MKVIGITGGVGAGKTQILSFLKEEYGAKLLVADRIAEELMQPGTGVMDKIREEFPAQVFSEDGRINRQKMAELIFADESWREKMNGIVHPAVKDYVIRAVAQERENGSELTVVEAALLIEEHYDAICDELWYIYTTQENRITRLKASRGYSEEKCRNIFASQLPEEEFRAHSKVVIDNNGSLEETCRQICRALNNKGDSKDGSSEVE